MTEQLNIEIIAAVTKQLNTEIIAAVTEQLNIEITAVVTEQLKTTLSLTPKLSAPAFIMEEAQDGTLAVTENWNTQR